MAKIPSGQFTKRNISKEWTKNIIGNYKPVDADSYKFKRYPLPHKRCDD